MPAIEKGNSSQTAGDESSFLFSSLFLLIPFLRYS